MQGKQIEGTFWRDMADKMDAELMEGQVYYFSNGNVSPSNRKFSTVDNDYKINFSEGKSEVKLADVQARSSLHCPGSSLRFTQRCTRCVTAQAVKV